jgi:hypothetical protein
LEKFAKKRGGLERSKTFFGLLAAIALSRGQSRSRRIAADRLRMERNGAIFPAFSG